MTELIGKKKLAFTLTNGKVCRVGESHQNTTFSDQFVEEVRLAYESGEKPKQIHERVSMQLAQEGRTISYRTIAKWIYCQGRNPCYSFWRIEGKKGYST